MKEDISGSNSAYNLDVLRHWWSWHHPLRRLRETRRNLKWAWQRIRYGASDGDVWDFEEYLEALIPYGIRKLAREGNGWPQSEEFPTYESWRDYLLKFADKWDVAFKGLDEILEENEYAAALHTMTRPLYHRKENEDGTVNTWVEETDEYKELRKKYWERMRELNEQYTKAREECWRELGKIAPNLWD